MYLLIFESYIKLENDNKLINNIYYNKFDIESSIQPQFWYSEFSLYFSSKTNICGRKYFAGII